jgi:hypothetical protein
MRGVANAETPGLKMNLATDKPRYRARERMMVRVTFENATAQSIDIVLPGGADFTHMFEYQLMDRNSGRWHAVSISPRSVAGDVRHVVLPGKKLSFWQEHLRFRKRSEDEIFWVRELPEGDYEMACTYNAMRAIHPANRAFFLLRSERCQFMI